MEGGMEGGDEVDKKTLSKHIRVKNPFKTDDFVDRLSAPRTREQQSLHHSHPLSDFLNPSAPFGTVHPIPITPQYPNLSPSPTGTGFSCSP